ncbi:MAG: NFACT RNA binding domain-containing protein [Candidatus Pacearchaeota archaeon]
MGQESKKIKRFREFLTSSGKIVLCGKNAENNEELIKQVGKDEIVLHTKASGSPFCNIKENYKKITKKDIYEAGVFCSVYSQDWKHNHKDVEMHIFLGKDLYKEEGMKTGTFGVKKYEKIIIKKQDIENFENEIKGKKEK